MVRSRKLEQHIAVFGESGSGKTVMLSSFYGAAQEPQSIQANGFNLLAENRSQGTRLSQNYLGMKNSARLPEATHFSSTAYSFVVKVRSDGQVEQARPAAFDALRLVWHDYPGEWFEQEVSGPEEAARRVDTFRMLLQSDVALLLVDGQKLLDHAGEEERYLKSLFTNYANGLLLLKDDLLIDGKKLVEFPRIWVLALSKCDVVPGLDVFTFRDLVLEKARDDFEKVRDALEELLESKEALSFGEDFVLMSSAKFVPGRIEFERRVGLDLILPIASVLPLRRHLEWAQAAYVGRQVALQLLHSAELVAVGLGWVSKLVARLLKSKGGVAHAVGLALAKLAPVLERALERAEISMTKQDADALAKKDKVAGLLARFFLELDAGETARVLLRRP